MSLHPEQLLLEFLGPPLPHEDRFPMNEQGATVERVLKEDLLDSQRFFILTGFASLEYIACFLTCIPLDTDQEILVILGDEPKHMEEATGQPVDRLPQRIESYWLNRGVSMHSFQAFIHLEALMQAGKVSVRHLNDLHSNLYVGDTRAVVGSSSFTIGGLRTQKATNVRFTAEPEANHDDTLRYAHLRLIAERYWAMAVDYQETFLNLLNQLSQLVSWQESLAFSLADLLEGKWISDETWQHLGSLELWPSQKQSLAQAMYLLNHQGSVVFADPAGSKKNQSLLAIRELMFQQAGHMRSLVIHEQHAEHAWEMANMQAPSDPVPLLNMADLLKGKTTSEKLLGLSKLIIWDAAQHIYTEPIQRVRKWIPTHHGSETIISTNGPVPTDNRMWKWISLLDPDVLPDELRKAFEQFLSQGYKVSDSATLEQLHAWLVQRTISRSRNELTYENDQVPAVLRDQAQAPGRFPEVHGQAYELKIMPGEEVLWKEVKELCQEIKGIVYLRQIHLEDATKEQIEEFILEAETKAFQACWSRACSSPVALWEYLAGSSTIFQAFDLPSIPNYPTMVGMLEQLEEARNNIPFQNLESTLLPEWLAEVKSYQQACDKERYIFRRLLELVREMTNTFERNRHEQLLSYSKKHDFVLVCSHYAYTAWTHYKMLSKQAVNHKLIWLNTKNIDEILEEESNADADNPSIIMLYDELPDSLRFSQVSSVLHLDLPAQKTEMDRRLARFTHMNQGFAAVEMHYPEYPEEAQIVHKDLPSFVDHLKFYFSQHLGQSDLLKVKRLFTGDSAIMSASVYETMRDHSCKSLVSMVRSDEDWAFFVIQGYHEAPQWIWVNAEGELLTDVHTICNRLETLLKGKESIIAPNEVQTDYLQQLIGICESQKEMLLPLKKRRALDMFRKLIRYYAKKDEESPAREAIVSSWIETLKEEEFSKIDIGLLANQLIIQVFDPMLAELKKMKPAQLWHLQKLLPILKKEPISTHVLSDLYEKRKEALPLAKQLRSCIIGLS